MHAFPYKETNVQGGVYISPEAEDLCLSVLPFYGSG